eukprot:COSAG01_NODE_3874_length_5600_cov_24.365206_5_plen_172_part_00
MLSCPCIARVFSPLGHGCNTGLSVQCGVDVSAINRLRAPAATAAWQHPRVLQLWQYPHLELSDVVEVATLPTDPTASPPSPSAGICGGAGASSSPGLYSCSVQLRTQRSGADHRDQRAATADTAVMVADALALVRRPLRPATCRFDWDFPMRRLFLPRNIEGATDAGSGST